MASYFFFSVLGIAEPQPLYLVLFPVHTEGHPHVPGKEFGKMLLILESHVIADVIEPQARQVFIGRLVGDFLEEPAEIAAVRCKWSLMSETVKSQL